MSCKQTIKENKRKRLSEPTHIFEDNVILEGSKVSFEVQNLCCIELTSLQTFYIISELRLMRLC